MSSVVTMGYQPQGSLNLVVSMGYGLSANAPLPPPAPPDTVKSLYGPALTPAERRRWFGDFESPISRAARRKCKEYLQRVEFGILPPEVKDEICQSVDSKVETIANKVIEERIARKLPPVQADKIINRVMLEMKSEIRQVLENRRIIEEESEEEDIVVISTYLLH